MLEAPIRAFGKYDELVKALTLSQWVGERFESRGFAIFFAVVSLLLLHPGGHHQGRGRPRSGSAG